ncbi:unnamed protein product, partial [Nesidiocoris tenuis]
MYQSKLKSLLRAAKCDYFKKKLDDANGDMKRTWCTVNEIIDNPVRSNCIRSLRLNGQSVDAVGNAYDCARVFNEHYVSVGASLANALPIVDEGNAERLARFNISGSSFCLKTITESDVSKIIDSIRGGSCPGFDGIQGQLLKQVKQHVSKPLAHLINLSFSKGIFPKNMKLSIISPIHKAGDKEDYVIYRPISLVSNIAKIIEKAFKYQLSQYLENCGLLSSCQYG